MKKAKNRIIAEAKTNPNWSYKFPIVKASAQNNLTKLSFTPTKFKQVAKMTIWEKLERAGEAFSTDGIVQNVFLTQVAMGMKSFEHKIKSDKGGKHKKIFDDIALRLRLGSFLRWFYMASLIYSNVYMVEFWGKRTYTWGTSKREMEVPIGLTLIDPLNGRILGSSMKFDKRIGLKVDINSMSDYGNDKIEEINSRFANKIFDGKVESDEITKYMSRSGNRPGDIVFKFNEEAASHFKPTCFDWERYGVPKLTGCLTEIQMKKKLQEVDFAVADGIINMMYVFKIGSDEFPMQDGEDIALSNLLKSPARTFSLIWNHRLEVDVVSPEQDTMASPERYDKCNDAIREALGYTFGITGMKGRRDVDKFVKLFAEMVEAERNDIAVHFQERIYRRIAEKNGLDTFPRIEFNKIGVAMSDIVKTIVGMLFDRGLVSRRTTLDVVEYDYDEEKARKDAEKGDEESFKVPELPFSKPTTVKGKRMDFDEFLSEILRPAIDEIAKERGLTGGDDE